MNGLINFEGRDLDIPVSRALAEGWRVLEQYERNLKTAESLAAQIEKAGPDSIEVLRLKLAGAQAVIEPGDALLSDRKRCAELAGELKDVIRGHWADLRNDANRPDAWYWVIRFMDAFRGTPEWAGLWQARRAAQRSWSEDSVAGPVAVHDASGSVRNDAEPRWHTRHCHTRTPRPGRTGHRDAPRHRQPHSRNCAST